MVLLDTCWGPREVIDTPYWHLIPEHGGLFYNNVRVGKGALLSVTAGIQAEPHLENAQTPYSLNTIHDAKERVFEEIRLKHYPTCPPRLKTLYVFDDPDIAERARAEWFRDEPKIVHECRILAGSVVHRADSIWLNCPRSDWQACAHRYWRGDVSENPFPEVLVHGALYFPDWQTFPVE